MIEWSIPYTLTSPAGTLEFNTPTTVNYGTGDGYLFLLDESKCSSGPGPLRITVDDVPQADGGIIHQSFVKGYTVKWGVRFWMQNGDTPEDRSPACEGDLRVMWDELLLHLNALKNPSLADLVSQCRIVYTPSSYFEDRMADQLSLVEWPTSANPVPETTADFALQSPLPYELDASQISAAVGASPLPYNNTGNTNTYPVFIVTAVGSPLTAFTIENSTIGQSIVYDSTLPGGVAIAPGDFVEISTFRNTMYLNGSVANRMSGLDMLSGDFFPLVQGTNTLQFTHTGGSATCGILYNYAWAN